VIGEDNTPVPDKLDGWLDSIKLAGYQNRFVLNGYGSMDRVRVIWELELVTVRYLSVQLSVLKYRNK